MAWWLHDITLALSPETAVFPGDPPVEVQAFAALEQEGYRASWARLSLHAGTHVDAPAHVLAGGAGVEGLPLDALLGPATVLASGPGPVTAAWLHERWTVGTRRLLLQTGGGASLRSGGPGAGWLTGEAAGFLAERGARLVGVESLSIDALEDAGLPAHRALLGRGVVVLEGIDLGGVAPGSYELACLPLKVLGGDGAPARAVLRR